MSAQGPPSPGEIESMFDVSPQQARSIAEAMRPLQDFADIGSAVGSALDNAPGSGPRLAGAVLENVADQTQLIASSAETTARAVEFYILAQQNGMAELLPPPDLFIEQVANDFEPIIQLLERRGP